MDRFSGPTRDNDLVLHDGATITTTQFGEVAASEVQIDFHGAKQGPTAKVVVDARANTVGITYRMLLADTQFGAYVELWQFTTPTGSSGFFVMSFDNVLFDEAKAVKNFGKIEVVLAGAGEVSPLIYLATLS